MDFKQECNNCGMKSDTIAIYICSEEDCENFVCEECSHTCEDWSSGCKNIWCLSHDEKLCEECGSRNPRCRNCSADLNIEKCTCIDCVNGFTHPERLERWNAYKSTGTYFPSIKKAY